MSEPRGGYLTPAETEALAENVVRLRLERDWTQEELAERAELSVSTLRALQSGRRTTHGRTLVKLTEAFGFDSPGVLLRPWKPPPEPPPAPELPPGRKAFERQLRELRYWTDRLADERPGAGETVYAQLAARIRTLIIAVHSETRRKDNR